MINQADAHGFVSFCVLGLSSSHLHFTIVCKFCVSWFICDSLWYVRHVTHSDRPDTSTPWPFILLWLRCILQTHRSNKKNARFSLHPLWHLSDSLSNLLRKANKKSYMCYSGFVLMERAKAVHGKRSRFESLVISDKTGKCYFEFRFRISNPVAFEWTHAGVYASKELAEAKREKIMAEHDCCGHGDISVGGTWEDEIDLVYIYVYKLD
jgi:hypothetical protein